MLGSPKASAETQARALAAMSRDVRALGASIDQLALLSLAIRAPAPLLIHRVDLVQVIPNAGVAGRSSVFVLADPERLNQIVTVLASASAFDQPPSTDLRVRVIGSSAEISVSSAHGPGALSVAVARVLAVGLGGVVEVAEREGKTILTVRLPLAPRSSEF